MRNAPTYDAETIAQAFAGARVSVFWNLHRDCYSVRNARGITVAYARCIHLDNVTFTVQASGRDKVRKTGKKTVHAFVRGTVAFPQQLDAPRCVVTYNPQRDDTFISRDNGQPMHAAPRALLAFVNGVSRRKPLVLAIGSGGYAAPSKPIGLRGSLRGGHKR